jgi:hypothetical protein
MFVLACCQGAGTAPPRDDATMWCVHLPLPQAAADASKRATPSGLFVCAATEVNAGLMSWEVVPQGRPLPLPPEAAAAVSAVSAVVGVPVVVSGPVRLLQSSSRATERETTTPRGIAPGHRGHPPWSDSHVRAPQLGGRLCLHWAATLGNIYMHRLTSCCTVLGNIYTVSLSHSSPGPRA